MYAGLADERCVDAELAEYEVTAEGALLLALIGDDVAFAVADEDCSDGYDNTRNGF
ncbi:MAG: hypothetical protein ACJA1R_001936 [Flavobacteriales bacterium]|jgi:hypothetical protein